jgi:hypothetical protein
MLCLFVTDMRLSVNCLIPPKNISNRVRISLYWGIVPPLSQIDADKERLAKLVALMRDPRQHLVQLGTAPTATATPTTDQQQDRATDACGSAGSGGSSGRSTKDKVAPLPEDEATGGNAKGGTSSADAGADADADANEDDDDDGTLTACCEARGELAQQILKLAKSKTNKVSAHKTQLKTSLIVTCSYEFSLTQLPSGTLLPHRVTTEVALCCAVLSCDVL